jgi:CHAT domain-containing protein/tetratricopeptide (TPR) repeat protein
VKGRVAWCLGLVVAAVSAVAAQDAGPAAQAAADRLLAAPQAEWARLAGAPEHATAAVAEVLVERGNQARLASEFTRAAAVFGAAQAAARRANAPAVLGAALNGAADAWFRQGAFEPTLAAARESVALHEREQLPAGLAQAWNTIGNVHHGKAEYRQALECYEKSLALREPLGDQRGIGQSLNNIGAVHKGLGHFSEALVHYRRALDVFEGLGEKRPAAIVADNIGLIHFHQGDYGPALEYTRRALAASQAVDNTYGAAKSYDTLGNIYRVQGAYGRALDAFDRALALRQSINARASVAETVNNIGLVHVSQGNYGRAIDAFRRALRLNHGIGDQSLTVESMLNLGAAAWRDGQATRAIANLHAALAISEREGFVHLTAETLHDLGEVAHARGRAAEAEARFTRALALRESITDRAGVTSTLTAMASARLAAGRVAEAVALGERAVANATTYAQPELLWGAQTVVGLALRRHGRPDAARAALAAAIDGVEHLRRQVVGDAVRQQFFGERLSPYHALVDLAAERQDGGEALAIAERAKARSLTDLLRRTTVEGAPVAGDTAPSPALHLDDVGALLRDDATGAVEYVVGPDRAYAIAIQRRGGVAAATVVPLRANGRALATIATRLRDRIAARDLLYAEDARRLHDVLLGPVLARLPGVRRLVVVPDGPLWHVPFQALRGAQGRFVADAIAVSYAPSLTALREVRRRPAAAAGAGVLAMGLSTFGHTGPAADRAPLPEAEPQARAVAALYRSPAAAYVGAEATEARFKRDAGTARVLHLATHGELDEASPLYSRVVLAPGGGEDGALEAWELLRLRLDADVVVLSACETGRGRVAPGEGLVGMTWALFAAGARAMVASQWRVESASTSALMTAFHRGLAAGGGPAERLRDAGLEVRRTPGRDHPFYWAGFVLVGAPF